MTDRKIKVLVGEFSATEGRILTINLIWIKKQLNSLLAVVSGIV